MVCSICGLGGHNKRTCSQTFSLTVVAVVWEKWSVMSGDPTEMNLVTESEEVDISTEGFSWGDLPLDAVNLILDLVEKYNTDYHEDRVRMVVIGTHPLGHDDPFNSGGKFSILRSRANPNQPSLGRRSTVLSALLVDAEEEVGGNWQKTGRELRRVVDALYTRHRALTPKAMKYKYLAEHTKYHTGGSRRCAYNGWYSWYHTLEQRENSIQNEYWNRRSR